jgi:hypothetical protein
VALLRERSRKLPRGQQRWPRLIACNQNQSALMTVGPSIVKGPRNLGVISYQVAQGSLTDVTFHSAMSASPRILLNKSDSNRVGASAIARA